MKNLHLVTDSGYDTYSPTIVLSDLEAGEFRELVEYLTPNAVKACIATDPEYWVNGHSLRDALVEALVATGQVERAGISSEIVVNDWIYGHQEDRSDKPDFMTDETYNLCAEHNRKLRAKIRMKKF